MEGRVAVTHHGWCDCLSRKRTWEEVSFWTPSDHCAVRGTPGAPSLFTLRSPRTVLGGFGFFSRFDTLPEWLAWECFKEGSGANDTISPLAKASASGSHVWNGRPC